MFGILYADNSAAAILQPRVAEIVASRLRDDILSGRLKEGDDPPPQESLFGEFVRAPRRSARPSTSGNQTDWFPSAAGMSGAVVHLPSAERTANMISMVLQAGPQSADVSGAQMHLKLISPACAPGARTG